MSRRTVCRFFLNEVMKNAPSFQRNLTSFHRHPSRRAMHARLFVVRPFGAITSRNYELSETEPKSPIDWTALLSVKTLDEANQSLAKWLEEVKYGALHPGSSHSKETLSPLETIELLQSDRVSFQPEAETYALLIQGAIWKRWDKDFAPKKAAKLLDQCLKALMKDIAAIEDKKSLLKLVHKVMTSWVQTKNVARAEEWLKILEEPQSSLSPTSLTYSIVINGWCRNQVPQKAEATLYRMISRKQTEDDLVITKTYFHRCLDAWVRSNDKIAGERSEVLLLNMQDENDKRGLEGGGPCIQSWFKVVCAWTNSNKSHREAAPRAQRILDLILENDDMDWSNSENRKWLMETYLQVMRAWSFHGGNSAFERIGVLFHDQFVMVNTEDVTTLTENVSNRIFLHWVTSLVKSDFDDIPVRLKSVFRELAERKLDIDWNTNNFNLVLNVYAKAKDGPEAENMLKKMLQLALEGRDDCLPNTQSFNSVILAWSKSGDRVSASIRAEEIYNLMKRVEGVTPVTATYNALLSAMGGSTDVATARRGESYLEELKRAYAESKNPSFRPSNITYTKAILLWSNITTPEAVDRADALLQELLSQGGNDDSLRPTVTTYKAFQSVLASSNVPDKRKRSLDIHAAILKLR